MGLVRLVQSERTVLEAEISSYRAEGEKQRKVGATATSLKFPGFSCDSFTPANVFRRKFILPVQL